MVLRIKRSKDRSLLVCMAIATWLCLAQVLGSMPVLLACLMCFLMYTALAAYQGKASPVLLFFLPWAPLLKLAPDSLSFYTFSLIAVCVVTFWKKRFAVNIYCVLMAIPLTALTLFSKMLDSSGLSASYILFIFSLFLFPIIMDELRDKVDFTKLTISFSVGIIVAALSAQQLMAFPRIARYINVYSWNVVRRLSGYYGDANFYSAHISAALGGVLLIFLREEKGTRRNWILALGVALLYCGFLSASKAFFVTIAVVFMLWFVKFLVMRGKIGRKLFMLAGILLVFSGILASGIFDEQWNVIVFRFRQSTTLSGLTTGRTDIWMDYLRALSQDFKLLLLGRGYTITLVNGVASHNTVIQIIYQFGILGSILLLAWEYYFIRGTLKYHRVKIRLLDTAVLLTGAFLPWMALDLAFFDEFFLMPLYVAAGLVYQGAQHGAPQEADSSAVDNHTNSR